MKNIQAQYQDLLEGKMSKANFMRNIRMQFPQHVSPVTSFDDSVKILKGKRILSEAKKPEGVYGHNPNAETEEYRKIDHLNYYQVYHGIQFELAKMPEITDEAYIRARKKVVDKILKDPDAYKDLQLANFKAVKVMDKDLEMKPIKKDNLKDKPNEMKVVSKDAKGNTQDTLGKKEARKAKNGKGIQHMTQSPKGGLKAFETPGKEKVMTLKEHILDEMTNINPTYEYIGTGARVKKKDDSKAGEVLEFDGDTATVKWDDGETGHIQMNVLTKKDVPNPQAKPTENPFAKLPDLGELKQDFMNGQVKEDDPYGEDPNLDIKADKDIPSQGMTRSEKRARIEALKEKVEKMLKREGVKKNPKSGEAVSTSTPADDALASKMGYTQTVPTTIKALGKI